MSEQSDSAHLKLEIISLTEEVRVKTIKHGYPYRRIRIVIPENLRYLLGDFEISAYGGFTFSVEYDARLQDDIYVFPEVPEDKPKGRLWRIWQTFNSWLDRKRLHFGE